MNNLDKQYTALLQDILDNGTIKKDRTGTGTISVFGRQIRHKMSEGFPLLTTKKMYFKGIVTEMLWFLRGDTNIKYLVDNDCNIWTGDAYKKYLNDTKKFDGVEPTFKDFNSIDELKLMGTLTGPISDAKVRQYFLQEFIDLIKSNETFAKKWGDLGPIYGKQWRNWETVAWDSDNRQNKDSVHNRYDQITNLINDLKNNPDSRRLMVSAWNVGEIDRMTLPPCHYGFQVYTRDLNDKEMEDIYHKFGYFKNQEAKRISVFNQEYEEAARYRMKEVELKKQMPTKAISLMWNQRSVDTFLGLPFNIASYGLLLEILAKEVNMVPDELIGNLGDTHLYLNHIDQAREQIGIEMSLDERISYWFHNNKPNRDVVDDFDTLCDMSKEFYLNESHVPKRTREPYQLPTLKINLYDTDISNVFDLTHQLRCWKPDDFVIENYKSHSTIKAPLSN